MMNFYWIPLGNIAQRVLSVSSLVDMCPSLHRHLSKACKICNLVLNQSISSCNLPIGGAVKQSKWKLAWGEILQSFISFIQHWWWIMIPSSFIFFYKIRNKPLLLKLVEQQTVKRKCQNEKYMKWNCYIYAQYHRC